MQFGLKSFRSQRFHSEKSAVMFLFPLLFVDERLPHTDVKVDLVPAASLVHLWCCLFSEGSPFSWWLGGRGSGRLQTYWGGAQPGSRQCACGLQGDCVDPHHYCNCDADRMDWYWYFFSSNFIFRELSLC